MPQTHNLLVSQKQRKDTFFPTLHPLSLLIFATATVVAFVLLHNSRFNFHCYTQREATPTQKSARKWRCNLLRHLVWKITKGIHLCKPASLNHPTMCSNYYKGDNCCLSCLSLNCISFWRLLTMTVTPNYGRFLKTYCACSITIPREITATFPASG